MRLLYPQGLLGLLLIPVLILIYILKNKYTEQTVASTYLWTLSRKFLKRKRPLSRLIGLISLILQILAVTLISLTLAHPILTLPGEAQAYCFILDGSGSMQTEEAEGTRFDLAKGEIRSLIETSVEGSTYTLVLSDVTTRVIYEGLTEKETALMLLSDVTANAASPDTNAALSLAQTYFDNNPATLTYLVTDIAYASYDNLQVKTVGDAYVNCGVNGVSVATGEDGMATVSSAVTAYGGNKSIHLDLYVDDTSEAAGSVMVSLTDGKTVSIAFDPVVPGKTYTVVIREEDALTDDNTFTHYDVKTENAYKVLLVSQTPFFWESVIGIHKASDITTISPEAYTSSETGYGLYVFDNYTPSTLPKDGTVWLVNPTTAPALSGFSVKGETTLENGGAMELTQSTASLAVKLTAHMTGSDLYVKKYNKCGFFGDFTTLLSYQSNPLVVSGTNGMGNRQVVFTFSLHDSNLPLTIDFIALTNNLLTYSFPTVLESVSCVAGDTFLINAIPNCESISVTSPSGEVTYLNTGTAVREYVVEEVGAHTVTLMMAGTPREYRFFASLPEAERLPTPTGEDVRLQGTPQEGGMEGILDDLTIPLIFLVVVFLADWGIYCYEKYQLR